MPCPGVDTDPQACSRALDQGAFQVFDHVSSWTDVDGFVVAVPIPDLAPVTASLLAFEKPVFVEKTLCRSKADYQMLRGLSVPIGSLPCINGITIPESTRSGNR
jgi:predicted dehydrogenase